MRIEKEKAVLLMIDMQEKLYPHMENKESLLARASMLATGIQALDVPRLAARQYPRGLGDTLEELRPFFDGYHDKLTFSCCGEDSLVAALKATGRTQVIVIGIEAHVCVLQTVLDLHALGWQPVVVADAVSSRRQYDCDVALRRMEAEGALLTTTESILFELCRQAGDAAFKTISKLVK